MPIPLFSCSVMLNYAGEASDGRQQLTMPNVMVALSDIGGALCSTPQSLADAHYLTAMQ